MAVGMKDEGYAVWGAGSAEEFYRRFAIDSVNVVLLDIGLPGEDGISVARHLRKLPELTVMIVSARDALDDRLAGFSAGADRYLTKPVNLAELAANIGAIGRRSASAAPIRADGFWRLEKLNWLLINPEGKTVTLTAREQKGARLELFFGVTT